MIDAALFETASLYKKHPYEAPGPLHLMEKEFPNINMWCQTCKANQTFHNCGCCVDQIPVRRSGADPQTPPKSSGSVDVVWYLCAGCGQFGYSFLVRIADDGKSIMKTGQYPPWSIEAEPHIKEALGDHLKEYKKGLICESQGFGIGAFAYYRRIVETLIEGLLDDIGDLLKGEAGHAIYVARLLQVKDDHRAEVKIGVVKDLLPPILRPNNINPLADLHGALSMGLHSESDEDCLALAESIRISLAYLVGMVTRARAEALHYSSHIELIKKKLERRGTRSPSSDQRNQTDSPPQF